jgi:HEAT repeat protein
MQFESYLAELKDASAELTASGLTHLDGLTPEQASALRGAWAEVETERRRQVVRWLADLAEDNVELNFDAALFVALEDPDATVRQAAIKGLWEYEGRDLIALMLRLLEKDEEPEVRAEAALALGRYVLASEFGGLGERHARRVEDGLRRAVEDDLEEDEVRARALEAIAAAPRQWVEDAIEQAYESETLRMRVSAVHAMGRSCEGRWLPVLLEELSNEEAEMRYEAATALGSLADRRTATALAPLLHDEDEEVREAAIWALGQIGGSEAKELLRSLAGDGSPGVREAVAAALTEADFAEDPLSVAYEA